MSLFYKFTDTLTDLEPVAEKLINNMQRYIDYYRDGQDTDLPYYYNERASVSLLAAAFARQDWLVMEEFAATKAIAGSDFKRMGETYKGRTDLWVACPEKEKAFLIEAKQCFFHPSDPDTWPAAFIHAARDDARRNDDGDARPLAVTFLVPSMTPPVTIEDVAGEARRILALLAQPATHGVICWFPKQTWTATANLGPPFGVRCWPGVIIAFHLVDEGDGLTPEALATLVPDGGH